MGCEKSCLESLRGTLCLLQGIHRKIALRILEKKIHDQKNNRPDAPDSSPWDELSNIVERLAQVDEQTEDERRDVGRLIQALSRTLGSKPTSFKSDKKKFGESIQGLRPFLQREFGFLAPLVTRDDLIRCLDVCGISSLDPTLGQELLDFLKPLPFEGDLVNHCFYLSVSLGYELEYWKARFIKTGINDRQGSWSPYQDEIEFKILHILQDEKISFTLERNCCVFGFECDLILTINGKSLNIECDDAREQRRKRERNVYRDGIFRRLGVDVLRVLNGVSHYELIKILETYLSPLPFISPDPDAKPECRAGF